MYRRVFTDPREPRTVVIVPSLTLDPRELAKIVGVTHYEERLLCLLMLLRMPRTQVIYVTSNPLDPAIVDYYLHLLPGVPGLHARERLTLISCDDPALVPLSRKILERPDVLNAVRSAIQHPCAAHMTCFNATEFERTLAVQLNVPMYACDPALIHLGNKSMSRALFQQVGLDLPDGYEHLRDRGDLIGALTSLHRKNADLRRAVVKLNDGFSGEGNAILNMEGLGDATSAETELERRLTTALEFESATETWDSFESKFGVMGGIVEEMIEGDVKRSPSVQVRIDPTGGVHLVSTHDQVLGGPNSQVFEGCRFPARPDYRLYLHEAGWALGAALRDAGVLGRFGVDFISVPTEHGWRHYAIEINLRKGGTTLPYLMLEFLTDGAYDAETGVFTTPTGSVRTYYATDNLVKDGYRGLEPAQLIDLAVLEGLHYHAPSQSGLVFHLLGAAPEHGKIGLVSIAEQPEQAADQYDHAVERLDAAAAALPG